MNRLKNFFTGLVVMGFTTAKDEKGQTLIEYVLVLVIAVLAIVAIYNWTGVATAIGAALTRISTCISGGSCEVPG